MCNKVFFLVILKLHMYLLLFGFWVKFAKSKIIIVVVITASDVHHCSKSNKWDQQWSDYDEILTKIPFTA